MAKGAHFIHVRDGYKYQITNLGKEIGKIRAKFDQDYSARSAYEKSVPMSWITNKYVEEVPINGEVQS